MEGEKLSRWRCPACLTVGLVTVQQSEGQHPIYCPRCRRARYVRRAEARPGRGYRSDLRCLPRPKAAM